MAEEGSGPWQGQVVGRGRAHYYFSATTKTSSDIYIGSCEEFSPQTSSGRQFFIWERLGENYHIGKVRETIL